MSDFTSAGPERTIGTIIKDLSADISNLLRSEVELLKLELKQSAAKLGSGAGLMVGALFFALTGVAFLFVTITLGLVALGVPAWLSSLIVTLLLFASAAVLAVMGKKKLENVSVVPTQSIGQIRADIDSIKADMARVRNH